MSRRVIKKTLEERLNALYKEIENETNKRLEKINQIKEESNNSFIHILKEKLEKGLRFKFTYNEFSNILDQLQKVREDEDETIIEISEGEVITIIIRKRKEKNNNKENEKEDIKEEVDNYE